MDRNSMTSQATSLPIFTLGDDDKDRFGREIERLTDNQLQERWLGEADEAQLLIDAKTLNPGLIGIDGIDQSIDLHFFRRDAIDALIRQRERMAASAASLALKGNGSGPDVGIAGLALSDSGNAEAFARMFGDRVRYDHRRRKWLLWIPPRWHCDVDGEIDRLALLTTRERGKVAFSIEDKDERRRAVRFAQASESRQRLDALIELAQSTRPIADPGKSWDTSDWLLGCDNAVVDLQAGKTRDGRPEDRLTLSTGIEFDIEAEAPRWESIPSRSVRV